MKIALDSNILLYIAKVWRVEADAKKGGYIESLIVSLVTLNDLVVPWQAFGECYHVMQRFGYAREKCNETIVDWASNFETTGTSETAFLSALGLATNHKLQFWDALILNAAADAGCTLLLSEDMQAGFSWRGVTIANPFADELNPLLLEAIPT